MSDSPTVPVDAPSSGNVVANPSEASGATGVVEPVAARRGGIRRRRTSEADTQHTRISGAWTAAVIAVLLGVALVDFIVENTRSVRIDFFSASGHIPVAVALLAAALAGAFVVVALGICRTAQLRLSLRRQRRAGHD